MTTEPSEPIELAAAAVAPIPAVMALTAKALHSPRVGLAALEPLFRGLRALERGSATQPLVIVQIGDSHSSGDFFSARLRELFQERFGAAGRGPLPPGMADRYFNPKLVSVQATAGWVRAQAKHNEDTGPFGIANIRQEASSTGERMSLRSDEADGFDTAYATLLRRPGGGTAILRADEGPPFRISTAGKAEAPLWVDVPVPPGSREFILETAGDGPVTVLSWGTHRRTRGVVYANFGVIGARVDLLGRIRPDVLAVELAHLQPALVIVMFGTNEAFAGDDAVTGYEQVFSEKVRTLVGSGNNVLVLGPPDSNRRGETTIGRVCGSTPLTRVAAHGRFAGTPPRSAAWVRPALLDLVSAGQQSAAQRAGWMFWDWAAAMGGPCAMHGWTQSAAPLGQPDHVHLTRDGYRLSAEHLFAELMRGYAAWRP